jgi:hypothetical protein
MIVMNGNWGDTKRGVKLRWKGHQTKLCVGEGIVRWWGGEAMVMVKRASAFGDRE